MMVLLTAIVVVASEMKMNKKSEKVTMEDRRKNKIGGKNRSITLICNLHVRIYYLMYVHTIITSFKKKNYHGIMNVFIFENR